MCTDNVLSATSRCATEGLLKPSEPATDGVEESAPSSDTQDVADMTLIEPQSSSVRSEVNPVVIHHAQSSPVPLCQSQHSAAPGCTSARPHQAHESTRPPTKHSGSPGELKRPSPSQTEQAPSLSGVSTRYDDRISPNLFIEELASHSKGKNRATSIEVTFQVTWFKLWVAGDDFRAKL